jgi:hypothetical protein
VIATDVVQAPNDKQQVAPWYPGAAAWQRQASSTGADPIGRPLSMNGCRPAWAMAQYRSRYEIWLPRSQATTSMRFRFPPDGSAEPPHPWDRSRYMMAA